MSFFYIGEKQSYGADGPWSTFDISVGNPVQSFRCIAGITSTVVIVPNESEWCNDTCAFFYGGSSKTWEFTPSHLLPLAIGEYINSYSDVSEDNAIHEPKFGVDDTYLGKSAQGRKISSQYVAETDRKRFRLGTLGLFPGSVGPPGAQHPSLLSSLWESGVIPSLSIGYTAGSVNRNSSASLVLGGYDAARFDPTTTTTLGFSIDQNWSFGIPLDAISITGGASWEPEKGNFSRPPVFTVDSDVPHIWLPQEGCQLFEAAFGLIWDDSLELYLVNDTTHARLLSENPEVNLSIGNPPLQELVNYTLPYSAFDLRLTSPFVDDSTHYFPLKRASSPAEYMLGRTFLQETYISVDYERLIFNLSQASHGNSAANIVPIPSQMEPTQTPDPPLPSATNSPKGLSSAAYAGIGVGAGIAGFAALCLIIVWKKRLGPFRRKTSNGDSQNDYKKAELHGEHKLGIEAMEKERFELDAGSGKHEAMDREASELQTVEKAWELKGSGEVGVVEVEGSDVMYELPGDGGDVRAADERPCTA
ncbi:hypothetical protein J4E86_001095 [Alternaria arbusti]|uniref:uncharacterized protein n=1 Tax=Alternaria arbusti TaxID=232088 RepID=UPI00221F1F98|nr:uncharacterized protein J4E86_001095 [Alternaria arbusti]KAI4962063.1 hypothetical protein J4E86_001095 [Alternaria arbusti]